MDWVAGTKAIRERFRKYRYVALAALLGIFLMLLPGTPQKQPESEQEENQTAPDLQESLSRLLGNVEGAGRVEVLLTQKEGGRTIYQYDEDIREGNIRRDTVLVTGENRAETGLIRQVDPPVWQGAVILCQGADIAGVRLALVEAVKSATGLSSDRIAVLKMK